MADLSCRQAELLEADVEMGRASEADRMRMEVHLQRCEACAQRSERLRALTDALRAEPIEARVPDRALVASALVEAHDRPARTLAQGPAMPWLAAAAALLAMGSAAWWIATRDGSPAVVERGVPNEGAEPVALAGLATPCDAVVTHATAGARAFLVDAHERVCRIRLDAGELRLHVEPNAGVDLVVATPTANVKVVGTVFSVGVEEGFTSVVVYRGTVEVRRARETLRVTGGHRVGLARDREALVESANEEALEPLVELEERAASSADARGAAESAAGEHEELATAPEPTSQEPVTEGPTTPIAREGRRPAAPPETAESEAEGEEVAPEPADAAAIRDLRRLIGEGRTAEARQQALDRTEDTQHTRRRGELYTVIAESYEMERNWPAAYEWYDRVQRVSHGTTTGGNALFAAASLALERLGRPTDAVRLFESYIRQHPRSALHEDAYIGRCRALMAAGQRADAESCARAYLLTSPTGRHQERARRLLGEQQ